jgi:hypothetical protein
VPAGQERCAGELVAGGMAARFITEANEHCGSLIVK